MTFVRRWIILALPVWLLSAAPVHQQQLSVVPWPAELQSLPGELTLDAATRIALSDPANAHLQRLANYFAEPIRGATGWALEITALTDPQPYNAIVLALEPALLDAAGPADEGRPAATQDPYERDESYELRIDTERAVLRARTTAGLFYGIQTLRQLLPPPATRIAGRTDGLEAAGASTGVPDSAGVPAGAPGPAHAAANAATLDLNLPAVHIRDAPRFRYRGMHLDVARHFFPVSFIKRYIDLLAMYKLNTLHWHLTDDQGWRVEISEYPRLTEIGGCRSETVVEKNFEPYVGDGTLYCGFYTQDEIRDVVAYAAERYVNIVPEIEMPGHSRAAFAAYPELACTEAPFEVGTRWGVFDDIYCPSEETFGFLEDVLTEVMALFPSPLIHIGGDEAPKTRWGASPIAQEVMAREGLADEYELQSYFVRRIEVFLNANGRRLVGWDEILEGGLAPQATVMSWRGTVGGIEAARQGHEVIMTPSSHLYFDYYQGDPRFEPLAIGGYTPLAKVYAFEPAPAELSAEEASYILGGQANMWTEYIKTPEQVEYMALPRMLALAEVVWSPVAARDWDSFLARLPSQLERLEVLRVDYRIPEVAGLEEDRLTLSSSIVVTLSHPVPSAEIRFTLDGREPTPDSKLYSKPFLLFFGAPEELQSSYNVGTVSARAFMPSSRAGPISQARFSRTELVAPQPLDVEQLGSGLDYRYYELGFESARAVLRAAALRPEVVEAVNGSHGLQVPDAIPPARSSIVPRIGLPGGERETDFGAVFEGYLRAPKDGIYTFYVTSDDGAVLVVGDRVTVDHDGLHGMIEKSGTIALAAGLHPIALGFFQAGGAAGLNVSVRLDGGERHGLPLEWLFRQD